MIEATPGGKTQAGTMPTLTWECEVSKVLPPVHARANISLS
jgi:hypothetical protein